MTVTMLWLTTFGMSFCPHAHCDLKALLDGAEPAGYQWCLTSDADDPCDFIRSSLLFPEYRGYLCEKVGLAETGMTVWFCRPPPEIG